MYALHTSFFVVPTQLVKTFSFNKNHLFRKHHSIAKEGFLKVFSQSFFLKVSLMNRRNCVCLSDIPRPFFVDLLKETPIRSMHFWEQSQRFQKLTKCLSIFFCKIEKRLFQTASHDNFLTPKREKCLGGYCGIFCILPFLPQGLVEKCGPCL